VKLIPQEQNPKARVDHRVVAKPGNCRAQEAAKFHKAAHRAGIEPLWLRKENGKRECL
jgi:hypothetical protein